MALTYGEQLLAAVMVIRHRLKQRERTRTLAPMMIGVAKGRFPDAMSGFIDVLK